MSILRNRTLALFRWPAQDSYADPIGLEAAHLKMCSSLATELLARIKAPSPDFFERLVVALLFKMGYGGSRSDAGQAVGKAGGR